MKPIAKHLLARSLLRWASVVAWMSVIFLLSAQPSLPRLSDRLGALQSIAGHLVEYAVLAVLLQWALGGGSPMARGSSGRRLAWWAFAIAVIYGVTDELHQRFVPGRRTDAIDLLLDATGAAVALWIVVVAGGRWSRKRPVDERGIADFP